MHFEFHYVHCTYLVRYLRYFHYYLASCARISYINFNHPPVWFWRKVARFSILGVPKRHLFIVNKLFWKSWKLSLKMSVKIFEKVIITNSASVRVLLLIRSLKITLSSLSSTQLTTQKKTNQNIQHFQMVNSSSNIPIHSIKYILWALKFYRISVYC